MPGPLIQSLVFSVCLLATNPVCLATTVTIHTEDARATLMALQNPRLSYEQAMKVARLKGNLAVVRKLQEFRIASTSTSFANALYACAHDREVTDVAETAIALDRTKSNIPTLLALLTEIENNPATFQGAIEQRIAIFTPAQTPIHLDGYVIAAGDGGGYTFGNTDFYLNIGVIDDFIGAKSTMTHELYHAVQAAYAEQRKATYQAASPASAACRNVDRLFASLYEEGTARYVEDVDLLSQSQSEAGKRILGDTTESIRRARSGASLLDMSVAALDGEHPMPFDDVYDVGFLGHGSLYGIGYVMAKAIAEIDGPQGLVTLLQQPSYRFVLRYAQLFSSEADEKHPRLGANTVAVAKRLAAGCK